MTVLLLILPVIGNLFVNSNVILPAALTKCKGKISEGKEKNTNTAVLGHHGQYKFDSIKK